MQSFVSIQRETGNIESKWTMFSASIAKAAALSCRCNIIKLVNPEWWTPEVKMDGLMDGWMPKCYKE